MTTIGTRAHKFGSIYSRVKNMLQSGLISQENKPIWFDVYEAFPPEREPVYAPPPSPDQFGLIPKDNSVQKILYAEDWARVAVKRMFNDFKSVYNLNDQTNLNMSQRVIEIFRKIHQAEPHLTNEEIFARTKKIVFKEN